MAKQKQPLAHSTMKRWVGKRLTAVRKMKEPNQAVCARALGVPLQTWNGYEKGKVMPPPFQMALFCNSYKVTMDWLYRGLVSSQLEADVAALLGVRHPELFPEAAMARPAKYEPLLDALQAAGDDGLTLDDLEKLATDHDLRIERGSLRSWAWHLKQQGALAQLGPGRFAWKKQEPATEAAGSVDVMS